MVPVTAAKHAAAHEKPLPTKTQFTERKNVSYSSHDLLLKLHIDGEGIMLVEKAVSCEKVMLVDEYRCDELMNRNCGRWRIFKNYLGR